MNALIPSLHASIVRMLAEPVTCNATLPGTPGTDYRHAVGLGFDIGYPISDTDGVQLAQHTHPPHPDQALLDLCAELRRLQAGWQRLWDATPDEQDDGQEDQAFDAYSADVWPALDRATFDDEPDAADVPAQLRVLRATTPEGMRAKAAAIHAIEQACGYLWDSRLDSIWIMKTLVEDVAAGLIMPLGEGAEDGT